MADMSDAAKGRLVRSLGIAAPGRLEVFDLEEPAPGDGQCWVDTLYSALSAGTELSFLKATNPYLHARWDDELCVFREDEPSVRFPISSLGYMEVGRISESRNAAIDSGELVAMAYGHKSGHCADPSRDLLVTIPPDVDPVLGIYIAQMGPICANGLLHAAAEVVGQDVRTLADGIRGRCVLITGGGVVGLFTGLFALHHGAAAVAVADPTPARLQIAEALGMVPIDENTIEPWRYCKERWRHGPKDRGADVVFQCRGRAASLQTALRSARPQGVIVDLAFYQDGATEVRLGEEFHHNGLSIRCAQINRVPRGVAHLWDRTRLASETIELVRVHADAIRRCLITDVVPFHNAVEAVNDVSRRQRDAVQIVFAFDHEQAVAP
jgi:threonine dehydrogenase-like Zn-dependent dehydrogenase